MRGARSCARSASARCSCSRSLFPLILFAINGSALGAARKIHGFPPVSYRDFALAVPFIQGALFVAVSAGTDLARDIESGFFNRLALTPLRGSALLAGQLGGAVVVACVQSLVYLLVGIATGVGIASGVGGALVLLALSILIAFGFAGLGALLALRFGTGEAVQGFFPLLFVTVFLSSSSLPRNLIKTDWFREVATYNPVSYLIEGVRSLIITGWDGAGARAWLRLRAGAQCAHARLRRRGDEEPAGAHVRRFVFVARAVAWRSVHNALANPAILLPSLIFPLFFLAAFAGGLSKIGEVPNFDYKPGYTAFQFAFVFLQSAAFGGVFTGFAIARDFDSGFARRLLLTAPRRSGIIAGYALGALVRWLLTAVVITVAALIAGMDVAGNGVELIGIVGIGTGMNLVAALWACGVAMFLRTEQAGALDPDAGLRAPLPRAGVRAAEAAERLDPRRRAVQPGNGCA